MYIKNITISLSLLLSLSATASQTGPEKFAQLGAELVTPTETRLASGAPGPQYWQQRADYAIDVILDDQRQRISGSETINYHNNSPHSLNYIWLQLDQNRFQRDADGVLSQSAPNFEKLGFKKMAGLLLKNEFDGGVDIQSVVDGNGNDLKHTVVKTMMRVDLPAPLKSGEQFEFSVKWQHNIINAVYGGSRGGYEYFEDEKNYIYEIAQWYPRVAAYTDYQGWQHKQFLGNGEFTLEFGDFDVAITVPADHIVAATGMLQNADDVLSKKQLKRYVAAQKSTELQFIVTPDEAKRNSSNHKSVTKTWKFKAENVRDFAFASSRKFIWDAQMAPSGEREVLAMSFYPIEAEPLWSQYSTPAIAHTIDMYSRYTFDYPYPAAISVNGPIGGMEYPMISFNKPRPFADGTYWDVTQDPEGRTWERSKYGLISVIIHEVGHNYFPMIVNSDERQWTWMDEGLNTYLQFLTEQAWEEGYPSRRGEPEKIVEYMVSEKQVPVMTNSESLHQFGNNAYAKPATALNVLRESVVGRELFDFAFREYAQRWMFKRPTPGDFFRSIEDGSGIDLDWFWRCWFFGTEHVDVAISEVSLYQIDSRNPEEEKAWQRQEDAKIEPSLSDQRNKGINTLLDRNPGVKDFYTEFDEFEVTPYDSAQYTKYLASLKDDEKALLGVNKNFYAVKFTNLGGLVSPLPLRITYDNKKVEEITIPAEVWRRNSEEITKLFITDREIISIELDPYRSTADADTANNNWPRKPETSRFQLFKESDKPNYMRRSDKEAWEKPIL